MGKRWRKKLNLFRQQNGRCCICGDEMYLIKVSNDHPLFPIKSFWKGNSATFEHLDDRFSTGRGLHSGEQRVLLAHSKCNFKVGVEKQIEFYKGHIGTQCRLKFLKECIEQTSQKILAGELSLADRLLFLRSQEEYHRKVLAGQSVKQKVKRKEIKDFH